MPYMVKIMLELLSLVAGLNYFHPKLDKVNQKKMRSNGQQRLADPDTRTKARAEAADAAANAAGAGVGTLVLLPGSYRHRYRCNFSRLSLAPSTIRSLAAAPSRD